MYHGLLAVWKEADYTSHDVVAKLRGILKQKKIGHTGTLDPKAEGVLVVGLGAATKACSYLEEHQKEYRATMRLGVVTDTQDIWGTVLEERSPAQVLWELRERVTQAEEHGKTALTEEERIAEWIRETVNSFQGDYEQIPPMYSAKKVGGKKLYELARAGKVIERKPCHVRIEEIRELKWQLPELSFTVVCSEGTYIRTLCHDIGKRLGCGACMTALTRTRACGFGGDSARTLTQLEQLSREGHVEEAIIPIDKALERFPVVTVSGVWRKQVKNGNPVLLFWLKEKTLPAPVWFLPRENGEQKKQLYRVCLEQEGFIGLYEWNSQRRLLVPERLFLGLLEESL